MTERNMFNLSNSVSTMSVYDICSKRFGSEYSVQLKLNRIKNDYESIFSWDIKEKTGTRTNLMCNLIDKIQEKCKIIIENKDTFSLNRFSLQLVIVYELYMNKNYKESLMEIENIVKCLESFKCDEANLMQYSNVYNHIARSTNVYIALTLNLNIEKILEDIKSVNSFNSDEKAVMYSLKALVFMEYPPTGNDIALKFADEARTLHSTEPELTLIWLKAKGRVRRFHNEYMPDKNEINAVDEMLCLMNSKSWVLISAAENYAQVAFAFKLMRNFKESYTYYKRSSDLMLKFIALAEENLNTSVKHYYNCLLIYIDYPKKIQSNIMIDKIVEKLINVKHHVVYQALGKYYFKCKEDYNKAKMYLSRGMSAGDFSSAMHLIKLECILQPANKFQFVKNLNELYEVFLSPKRRLIILSQILKYYYYYENNAKEMMHYVRLYINQDIEDSLKKKELMVGYCLFKLDFPFVSEQFVCGFIDKMKNILIYHEWTKEEKKIHDDTFDRFYKISQIELPENEFGDDNNTIFQEQSLDVNLSTGYHLHNNNPYNDRNNDYNWRKQGNENKGLNFREQHVNKNKDDWRKQQVNTLKNHLNSNEGKCQYSNEFSFSKRQLK